ncbi:anthranilate synthase component I family protein [Bythopirellula polymerisocia]|uniref:Aminodeoxychorismate synthase component 1 n=1 Tax=Bythopirellula polymerisocia TaxID=2528003 RepID=A0A5C6CFB3_9BACT|nr:anthranilate synthase component I family protein [Bythopirellula polymerisocia]TWU22812.1 Aminodeoxychorismate synthase component 1 [Bythopirellula polymerisocia]
MIDVARNDFLPVVASLPSSLTAVEAFLRLAHLPHVLFLDSNKGFGKLGRYSFVAADPFTWFERDASEGNPLEKLKSQCQLFQTTTRDDMPPFQGGLAGLFGYELGQSLERLPVPRQTDFEIPAVAVGLYDVVLAFDHEKDQAWLISQGFPELEPTARKQRAEERLRHFFERLEHPPRETPAIKNTASTLPASQFDVGLGHVTSNLTAAAYQSMIERAVDYIHAGDVFQVNLSQRLLSPATCSSLDLYLKLRNKNPAPYAGFLNLGDWQICSSSPECFLRVRGRNVESRPIKGTRGRSSSPEADLFTGDELQLSEKDRAENVMIVDLMRNDFSRVCNAESVHVAELCQVETYEHVKHLVSSVKGVLGPGYTPIDLLGVSFPGGSITGAPKIRAMEIIAELEPTARGAYCGSLGYIGFDGQMDSSILIRTITAGGGWWQLPVGGGIVAQSDPVEEYRETWHKARGLLRAVGLG